MWWHQNNILIQLSCICLFMLNADTINSNPVVTILNGTLKGTIMRTRLGRDINAFLGIPYATPPLGELRFKPPKPANAWCGVRDAVENAAICTQRNVYTFQEEIVGEEDCLYLNVYTPRITCMPCEKSPMGTARYPVMIWFHGGGWITGAGHSEFYGPKFLLEHDVVLVTLNYRLGPLGFLSTEDLESPGNFGLKDQQQALRWVQENIVYFGGDPNSVTIFGESAGGASVHYHMINPLSQGLFHRVISQSGTVYSPWTLIPPGLAKENAKIVGNHLKCPIDDSKKLIECLRTKSPMEIIGTDYLFQKFGYCPMIPFRPVIEPKHPGAFITEDPLISIREGRLAEVPWMTGITSEEGSLKVASIYGRNEVKKLNDDFKKVVPLSLYYRERYGLDNQLTDEISDTIRKEYFGNEEIDLSDRSRFKVIDMYSDAWIIHDTHTAVQQYLKVQTSPLYYYYFAYRGTASFSSIFGDSTKDYGVVHADELQYLFPVGEQLFPNQILSEKDHEMIDIMTSLWFNFAKSGNPTPKVTELIPLKWKPAITSSSPEYLHIGSSINMDKNLLRNRMTFWDKLVTRMKTAGKSDRHFKDEL